MKSNLVYVSFYCLMVSPLISQQEEKTSLKEYKEEYIKELSEFKEGQENVYNAFKEQERIEFEAFKSKIEERWREYKSSTQKKFVRYNNRLDARSEVDFEMGTIEVEIQIESPESEIPAEKVQGRIIEELKELTRETDSNEIPILKDQLPTEILNVQGDEIDLTKTNKLIATQKPKKRKVIAKDGKGHVEYSIKIPLVKNHLEQRAEKYKGIIKKHSRIFKLDPSLVMAIAHVESHFNPKARSYVPAYGIMQIVPESGGRDAYTKLFNRDWIPNDEYLYSPEKNIELGCQYLSLLKNNYFNKVNDDLSAEYCIISGYNTGPGNVAVAFTGKKKIKEAKGKINKLSSDQVKQILLQKLPHAETKKYLREVLDKKRLYD
jgi:membrane-bound lytic murein transglycosylase C